MYNKVANNKSIYFTLAFAYGTKHPRKNKPVSGPENADMIVAAI